MTRCSAPPEGLLEGPGNVTTGSGPKTLFVAIVFNSIEYPRVKVELIFLDTVTNMIAPKDATQRREDQKI